MKRRWVLTKRAVADKVMHTLGYRRCLNCYRWHRNEYFCDGDWENPGQCYYEYYQSTVGSSY